MGPWQTALLNCARVGRISVGRDSVPMDNIVLGKNGNL